MKNWSSNCVTLELSERATRLLVLTPHIKSISCVAGRYIAPASHSGPSYNGSECIQSEASINQRLQLQLDGSLGGQLGKAHRTSLTSLPNSFLGHRLINYKSFFKMYLSMATCFPHPDRVGGGGKETPRFMVLKQAIKIKPGVDRTSSASPCPFYLFNFLP